MQWETIANALIQEIKLAAGEAWEESAEARAFAKEVAEDIAKLTVQYTLSPAVQRPQIEHEMKIARQSLETRMAAEGVKLSRKTREKFMGILQSVVGSLTKVLPLVVAAL
jgi:hypothetical protein